jgi:hypothetical protein
MRRILVAVAVAGLIGPALSAAPAAAQAPESGTCFTYSREQWVQAEFTATTEDCSQPHNGEVLGSVQVPGSMASSGHASPEVKGWAYRACQSVATDYVWKGKRKKYPKSTYVMPRSGRLNIQVPTLGQWNAGERWAVCLGQSRNKRLKAPQLRTGTIAGKGLKPYICMNPKNWRGTRCKSKDAVRLTNKVWLPKNYSAGYPGSGRLLKRTRAKCDKLRKRGWTLRTWFVAGGAAWDRGNRFGYCEIVK